MSLSSVADRAGLSVGALYQYLPDREAILAGKLNTRMYVMVDGTPAVLAAGLDKYRMVGALNNHLTVRSIKVHFDGALGSRGAWLLEPYADKPDSSGLNTAPVPDVKATAKLEV